eukprot:8229324-Lingulodinium_polyedra.AAC.1
MEIRSRRMVQATSTRSASSYRAFVRIRRRPLGVMFRTLASTPCLIFARSLGPVQESGGAQDSGGD